jgi:hypothetical protein
MMSAEHLNRLAIERAAQAPSSAATPPSTPKNLSVTVRNLGLAIQWSPVTGVDGYNLIINSDEDFSAPDVQVKVAGENTRDYFHNLGNVTVSRYVRIQSYKGNRFSDASASVSATSTEATSVSSAPADKTYNNVETELTHVHITTTGQTLLIMGFATLTYNGGEQETDLVLDEDTVAIATVEGATRNATGLHGHQYTVPAFRTPAAGAHTYSLSATNATGTSTCNASSILLLAMEVPFLTSASTPPTAPSIAPPVETSTSHRTGSERRGGYQ